MSIGPTLSLSEVIKLFKYYLGLNLSKTNLYYYVTKKEFPAAIPWGKPRKWPKGPVMRWFKEQAKTIKKD